MLSSFINHKRLTNLKLWPHALPKRKTNPRWQRIELKHEYQNDYKSDKAVKYLKAVDAIGNYSK